MFNNNFNFKKINNNYWFFVLLIIVLILELLFINYNKVVFSAIDSSTTNNSSEEDAQKLKDKLKKQIQEIEKQIENYESLIEEKQNEKKSLKNEIYILEKKLNKQQLEIRESSLTLKYINEQIQDTLNKIEDLERKLKIEKSSLAEYLKLFYKYKERPILFLVLQGNLSDFFNDLYALETIQKGIQNSFAVINELKNQLNSERNDLENQKDDVSALLFIQKIQRDNLSETKKNKNELLKQTQGQEKLYKEYLKKIQKTAAEIRKQLYILEGWGISLNFEEAYKKAKKITDQINIRPAFLLALLKVESNWGQNVGRGTWKQDMKPNQHEAFLKITSKLGLNPDDVPVSRRQVCPGGKICGWGGALGPAQFLPTTWLSYEEKIAKITGHNPPSPWDIDDAFAAAAIKLAEAGATRQTYQNEWKAAMIYFAGSRWNSPIYRFYGNSVLALAKKIQQDINIMMQ